MMKFLIVPKIQKIKKGTAVPYINLSLPSKKMYYLITLRFLPTLMKAAIALSKSAFV